jgi:N-acetylmuramoyl-L-alanine amidase
MVKEADLAVLRMTHCPAALVEIAFITNPAEEKMLQEEGFQDLAAEAIAQAAAKFLNLKLPAIEPVEKPLRVNAGGKVIPCQMLGDKVWVPVRDLAESLGHKVDWYEEDQTVKVS